MSNANDKLSTTSRAMLIGAMAGGGASIAKNWQAHQSGQIAANKMVADASMSALKVSAISGASTYVAEKMAGRPALSLLTILSVGMAGVYLLDQCAKDKQDE